MLIDSARKTLRRISIGLALTLADSAARRDSSSCCAMRVASCSGMELSAGCRPLVAWWTAFGVRLPWWTLRRSRALRSRSRSFRETLLSKVVKLSAAFASVRIAWASAGCRQSTVRALSALRTACGSLVTLMSKRWIFVAS